MPCKSMICKFLSFSIVLFKISTNPYFFFCFSSRFPYFSSCFIVFVHLSNPSFPANSTIFLWFSNVFHRFPLLFPSSPSHGPCGGRDRRQIVGTWPVHGVSKILFGPENGPLISDIKNLSTKIRLSFSKMCKTFMIAMLTCLEASFNIKNRLPHSFSLS